MCGKQGHHPFSVWSMVTISISHFLLVLNSATNILVYCLLSSKFREECSKILIRRKPLHTPQQCLLYVNKCCCFWKPKDRSSTSRIAENGNNLLEQSSKSKVQAIQFLFVEMFMTESRTASIVSQGSFKINNYVDKILPNLDPPPPSSGHFTYQLPFVT